MARRGKRRYQRLTDKIIRQARPGRYSDCCNCLYIIVEPTGSRHWMQRLTIHGRRRDLGLHGYPARSLAEARRVAFENRRVARAGGDPTVEAAGGAGPTVREVFELVTENRRAGWTTAGTEASWHRGFDNHIAPAIGDKPIRDVQLEEVRGIVVPHWAGRNSKGYVLRQTLDAIFAFAVAQQHRPDNPAANLAAILPKVRARIRHRPSLPYAEAPGALADWLKLDVREPVRLAVLFLVLTAARLREATNATWGEIDLAGRIWRIPAWRMKGRKTHTVPLSIQALQILERARALGTGDLVFPVARRNGRIRPAHQDMVTTGLRKLGRVDPDGRAIVAHGFRSTFRVWSIEVARTRREVGEAALAHSESDNTVKSYSRDADPFAERAELMQRWADYVLPLSPDSGDA